MKSKFNSQIHHRRSIRLKEYDYSENGYYYVTICTKNHECWFGNVVNGKMELNDVGGIVKRCWDEIPKHFDNVKSDEMVIMPNHMHGIVVIDGDSRNTPCRGLINQTPTTKWILQKNPKMVLGKIIRFFKAMSCRLIRGNGCYEFQWHRNYYESIIRDEIALYRIREYIVNNPSNWESDENHPSKGIVRA